MSKGKRTQLNMTDLNINEAVEEAIKETEVEETADKSENQAEPVKLPGRVVNCKKLNVRERPNINSKVLCVVEANSKLSVDQIGTEEWRLVTTEDRVKGYCMSKYVKIER